jgi:tetratricopeptide (TPR) repeat protein
MFLERTEEAHTIFLEFRGETIGRKPWETAILEDFAHHREAYRSRPLMDEIEKLFVAEGSTGHAGTQGTSPARSPAISMAALIQASDVNSGRLLVEQGKHDEALAVFRRGLDECKAKIEKFAIGQYNNRAIDDRNALVQEIGSLALSFLANGDYGKALDAVDYAMSALPSTTLRVYRAHALMLLGREDEAQALYLASRGEWVDAERTGEILILQNFAGLRKADLDRPLMDEIEQLFGAGEQSV